jgi:hypothetical protein
MDGQAGEPQEAKTITGQYANYLEIGHNEHEFVLNFGQAYHEEESRRVHTRIVTGPAYAKAFLKLLQGVLTQYEERFGLIDES